MSRLSSLIEEAYTVSADGFIEVAENVIRLQRTAVENGRIGDVVVEGDLITIPKRGELVVVGDLHGDLQSLLYIIEDGFSFKEDVKLVFLGDYGDRGVHSVEVYYVVLKLKEKYPEQVFLLRGNHEGPPDLLASPHDLPLMIYKRFSRRGEEVYAAVRRLFDVFHVAAIVEGSYVLLHGGAPSTLTSLQELSQASRLHPSKSILEEVLWNDPVDGVTGSYPSPRGAGRLFGSDITSKLLGLAGAKTLIRGHEPCPEGVEVRHEGKVLTLFSRKGPPYMNLRAAYLKLNLDTEPLNAYELANRTTRF